MHTYIILFLDILHILVNLLPSDNFENVFAKKYTSDTANI